MLTHPATVRLTRGQLVNRHWHDAGDLVEVEEGRARHLIAHGAAERVARIAVPESVGASPRGEVETPPHPFADRPAGEIPAEAPADPAAPRRGRKPKAS